MASSDITGSVTSHDSSGLTGAELKLDQATSAIRRLVLTTRELLATQPLYARADQSLVAVATALEDYFPAAEDPFTAAATVQQIPPDVAPVMDVVPFTEQVDLLSETVPTEAKLLTALHALVAQVTDLRAAVANFTMGLATANTTVGIASANIARLEAEIDDAVATRGGGGNYFNLEFSTRFNGDVKMTANWVSATRGFLAAMAYAFHSPAEAVIYFTSFLDGNAAASVRAFD